MYRYNIKYDKILMYNIKYDRILVYDMKCGVIASWDNFFFYLSILIVGSFTCTRWDQLVAALSTRISSFRALQSDWSDYERQYTVAQTWVEGKEGEVRALLSQGDLPDDPETYMPNTVVSY